MESNGKIKLNDVSDALLHALNDILCGTLNFKQPTPTAMTLHNRTMALMVLPTKTYWVVLIALLTLIFWRILAVMNLIWRMPFVKTLLQNSIHRKKQNNNGQR